MRIFKTKWFDRFAGKMGISDAKLRDIANGLEQCQWDADLAVLFTKSVLPVPAKESLAAFGL